MSKESSTRGAAAAAVGLLLITGAWWALAFWPVDTASSVWLTRAKSVCFGLTPSGLPDAPGWIALISQPLVMGAMYLSIWGKQLVELIETTAKTPFGRVRLAAPVALIALGVGAVSYRVASATENDFTAPPGVLPSTYPRLDREAPVLGLVDQNGKAVELSQFSGTPVLVTFAFGNCEAICPMVVHDVKEAQRRIRETGGDAFVVVVTLDPWRDTPSRLLPLFQQWELADGSYALGGTVEGVNEVLDAWDVPRTREPANGNIIHPRLSYIIDQSGRIAYAVSAGADAIADLVSRL